MLRSDHTVSQWRAQKFVVSVWFSQKECRRHGYILQGPAA